LMETRVSPCDADSLGWPAKVSNGDYMLLWISSSLRS
jgi:hypothetical protein